jgi:hypothetical protein
MAQRFRSPFERVEALHNPTNMRDVASGRGDVSMG